jgi:hypothetical protein
MTVNELLKAATRKLKLDQFSLLCSHWCLKFCKCSVRVSFYQSKEIFLSYRTHEGGLVVRLMSS